MIYPNLASQVLYARGQGGFPAGHFYSGMITAAAHADSVHRAKIAISFPELIEAAEMSTEKLREIAQEACVVPAEVFEIEAAALSTKELIARAQRELYEHELRTMLIQALVARSLANA